MLTSVIISLIAGVICLLMAVFNQKNTSLRITMGIIGIVLLFYGGYGYGSMNLMPVIETYDTGNTVAVKYPVTQVQVTSPVQGDSVSCRILTTGVYPENHDKDIWVLLKPSDNKFYPQSDYTNTSYKENGKWQVVTRFGGDQGETYDLFVFEADTAASQFFSETISKWKAANDYEGLELQDLPEGIQEIDRKQVNLARNCRGIH